MYSSTDSVSRTVPVLLPPCLSSCLESAQRNTPACLYDQNRPEAPLLSRRLADLDQLDALFSTKVSATSSSLLLEKNELPYQSMPCSRKHNTHATAPFVCLIVSHPELPACVTYPLTASSHVLLLDHFALLIAALHYAI